MKATVLIQARLGARRLPDKVLLKLQDKTVLEHVIGRAQDAKTIDRVIVATTDNKEDQAIVDLVAGKKIPVFCGSQNDVLDRFYQAAKQYNLQHIVRITADCPVIDPKIIDRVVRHYFKTKADYCANSLNETFPDGQDVEVFSMGALTSAWQNAKLESEREHVTPHIRKNPKRFKIASYDSPVNLGAKRWTLDEEKDYEFLQVLFKGLSKDNRSFGMKEVLAFLKKNPQIEAINHQITRNEGYARSVAADRTMDKNQTLYAQAKKIIPGGTQLLTKRPEMHLPGAWPTYFKRAKGCAVWDLNGKKYLDMSYMGIGACILGYGDPDVDRAVKKVIEEGSMTTLNPPEEVELAKLLCEIHPWATMARFARCGGEAMAIAVRIARAHAGKERILFCGYHGWHDWYLSANLGSRKSLDGHLLPGLEPRGVPRQLRGTAVPFTFNDTDGFLKLMREHKGKIAAVVMEPIRNYYPKKGFLETIRAAAQKAGAVLIFDEVSSGWRLNAGGAHLTFGIEPDIAVFAKAISNGYPMAAIIGRGSVMNAAQSSFISSTYWTERIGPAAALATIKKLKTRRVAAHLERVGKTVQQGWVAASRKHRLKIKVSGMYPLSHFTFEYPKPEVLKTLFTQEMLAKGFLATTALYASYAHQEKQLGSYLKAVDETFGWLAGIMKEGHPEKYLKNSVCQSGFKRLT